MNYKRLAAVLALPAFYLFWVLLAWLIPPLDISPVYSDVWMTGMGWVAFSFLAVLCICLLFSIGVGLQKLWKWLTTKPDSELEEQEEIHG